MSFPAYLSGIAMLAVLAVAAGWSAWRLRLLLMPAWAGAPARLAETVIAVGLVVLLAELLGLVGLIRPWSLVPVAAGGAILLWRFGPRPPAAPVAGTAPEPAAGRAVDGRLTVALAITFLMVVQWGAFVAHNLDQGITNFDSVWYHLPYATEIARTGSVTFFPHTETVFTNWFYPQNSELLQAVGISLTGREFFSIFLNLGWLGMALLAGWCVGRPYGRGHLSLAAVAIVLASHTLVVREPGTAKNDVMAIALVLAAVAMLVTMAARHGRRRLAPGWPLAVAGLAAGLAAGTKVTALAPVVALTVAVLAVTEPGRRLRAAGAWLTAAAAGGGWWYLRNLLATGNPIPQMRSLGPFTLPGPERLQEGRVDTTVADLLDRSDIWREYFLPGLNQAFGVLWPLLLAVAVAGCLLLVWRGPGRWLRALGVVGLVAMAAYLVTPLSAAGNGTAFAINLRFLAPALALALAATPLSPWFERRWPVAALAVIFGALLLAAWAPHPPGAVSGSTFGIVLALALAAVAALVWLWRRRPGLRPGLAGLATLVMVAGLLAGWQLADRYSDNRYSGVDVPADIGPAWAWAAETTDSRIGLAGTTAGFNAFGFYGPDLSNRVFYLGADGPKGTFYAIGSCEPFVAAVNALRLDYLVTSPFLPFDEFQRDELSPELGWIRGDPALKPVVTGGPVRVWQLDGELDPTRCFRPDVGHDGIPGRRGI